MTKEVVAKVQLSTENTQQGYRTKRLVHFFRAVSLFAMPVRCTELGLRRRK